MKSKIKCILILSILAVSCGTESSSTSENNISDKQFEASELETVVEDTIAAVAPPPPPVSEVKDSIQKVFSAKSPFLEVGCCESKENRLSKCCCEAVLEEYKTMTEDKNPKLGEYKMTDPILGKCRKKMVKAFDLIDNPPTEGREEDDYDNLD